MKIIGVDLHARQQTIAMSDTDTGELVEKPLEHEGGESAGVLLRTQRSDSGGNRSDRIDAVVSEADGGTRDRMPSGSSGEDPQGGDTEAKDYPETWHRPRCTTVGGRPSCNGEKNRNVSRSKSGSGTIAAARRKSPPVFSALNLS